MQIQTKFDTGDYAYYKEDNKWYLVEITGIIIIKKAYGITGAPNLDEPIITYDCEWCEVTGHPSSNMTAVFKEEELYTKDERGANEDK